MCRDVRGNIDDFLRGGNRKTINRSTNGSRCDICIQNSGSTRLAEPGRPAARTDYKESCFLETVTFTPTWMRPLIRLYSSLHHLNLRGWRGLGAPGATSQVLHLLLPRHRQRWGQVFSSKTATALIQRMDLLQRLLRETRRE
jgi:hypothetical protein